MQQSLDLTSSRVYSCRWYYNWYNQCYQRQRWICLASLNNLNWIETLPMIQYNRYCNSCFVLRDVLVDRTKSERKLMPKGNLKKIHDFDNNDDKNNKSMWGNFYCCPDNHNDLCCLDLAWKRILVGHICFSFEVYK
jgi:hypothetical protein